MELKKNRKVIIEDGDHIIDEVMFHCHACGDFSHYVVMSAYTFASDKDDKVIYPYIYIADVHRQTGILNRIKAAYKFLIKGEHYNADVGMNRSDIEATRDWCDKLLKLSDHSGTDISNGDI